MRTPSSGPFPRQPWLPHPGRTWAGWTDWVLSAGTNSKNSPLKEGTFRPPHYHSHGSFTPPPHVSPYTMTFCMPCLSHFLSSFAASCSTEGRKEGRRSAGLAGRQTTLKRAGAGLLTERRMEFGSSPASPHRRAGAGCSSTPEKEEEEVGTSNPLASHALYGTHLLKAPPLLQACPITSSSLFSGSGRGACCSEAAGRTGGACFMGQTRTQALFSPLHCILRGQAKQAGHFCFYSSLPRREGLHNSSACPAEAVRHQTWVPHPQDT